MSAQEQAHRQSRRMARSNWAQQTGSFFLYHKWKEILEALPELPLSAIERQVLESTLKSVLERLE
jgi:hypothetical protein